MLRTPELKEQAKLLAKLLKAEGFTLAYQKALHVIAQLHGHRNWNTMQAALEKQPDATQRAERALPTDALLRQMVAAARDVVSNADNEGCSDDLTVTSFGAVERLDACLQQLDGRSAIKDEPYTVHGFGIGDVQSLRPDLSDEQALRVLEIAKHRFDANIGINWDVLQTHADLEFPNHLATSRLAETALDTAYADVLLAHIDRLQDPCESVDPLERIVASLIDGYQRVSAHDTRLNRHQRRFAAAEPWPEPGKKVWRLKEQDEPRQPAIVQSTFLDRNGRVWCVIEHLAGSGPAYEAVPVLGLAEAASGPSYLGKALQDPEYAAYFLNRLAARLTQDENAG